MKKVFKYFIILLMIFFIGFKNEIKAEETCENGCYAGQGSTDLKDVSGGTWFRYKFLNIDGKPAAYCLDRKADSPVQNVAKLYKNNSTNFYTTEKRKIISAIIDGSKEINSAPSDFTGTDTEYQYFIAELALNLYLHDEYGTGTVTETTKRIVRSLANTELPTAIEEIKISSKTNEEQTLGIENVKDGYVKSELITIGLNQDVEFTVSAEGVDGIKIVNASNKETTKFKKTGSFYILVPESKISANSSKKITYKIKAEESYIEYKPATIYDPEDDSQDLAVYGGKDTKTVSLNQTYDLTIVFNTYAQVKKVDKDTNKTISGAKLQLLDSNKKEMSCKLSDTNTGGTTSSNCSWTTTDKVKYILNLDAGTYYLKEISSPNGYALKTELQKVTVTKGNVSIVMIQNSKNKITFSKKDATGNAELPGATLEIQDKDGNTLHKWISTSTPKVIEGMAPGKYYFVETIAPEGYVLSKEKVEFEITTTTATKTVTMSNKLNKVVISKKDATGNAELPGATLHVLDKDKKSMSCTILKDGKEQKLDKCTWVSGTKSVEIVGLKAGKYYLKETIAPTRYVLSEEMVSFEVKEDQEVTNVEMKNKLNKVVISKINAFNKKELPGASLEIQNEDGEIVKYCSDKEKNNECKWVSTEESYVVEGLPNGTYYLVETIAPKGFVLNKEKVKFTVDGKTAISYVQMTNELEVEVPDTLSSRSVLLVAISMFDIALGIGIINYVKKNKYQE